MRSSKNPVRLKLAGILLNMLLLTACATAQMRQVHIDTANYNNPIEKIAFYSPREGYVTGTDNGRAWIGYTSDSGHTFTKNYIALSNVDYNGYSVNLTFGFGPEGIKAFSKDTLLAYGDYGLVPAILYSTDGGTSFKLVYHSQYSPYDLTGGIMDMTFPENGNTGYAVDANRILKTTNGGRDWFMVCNAPGSFFTFLEATDNNHVFTFGTDYNHKKFLKTADGGATWQPVSVPAGTISYATFLSPQKGWLNIADDNHDGQIYYTTNGGASWIQKNNLATSFLCSKMKFVNDSTGFAISGLYSVFKTTDSGKVWEPLPRDKPFTFLGFSHNDMQVLNANQLWAGGARELLELSTNGGGAPLPKAYFRIDTSGVYRTAVVKLINYSKPGYSYQWYVNNVFIGSAYQAQYTHKLTSKLDSVVLIVTNRTQSDTLLQYQYFNVPPLPVISSFTPLTGSTGTLITISGKNFSNVTGVRFGGVSAADFTVVSDTLVTAIVANGATGTVSLTTFYDTYSLPGFTYFPSPSVPPPTLTSLSPTLGPAGTVVTITGTNFDPTPPKNVVYFGAVQAHVTAASATQLSCVVPAGASYAPVSVLNTTSHLTGFSHKPFDVTFADSGYFKGHSFTKSYTLVYPQYADPGFVAGADIDGDNKADLITAVDYAYDSIYVYRNISDTDHFQFDERVSVGIVGEAVGGTLSIGDLDGDGKPDLTGINNTAHITIFKNESLPGHISFSPGNSLVTRSGLWNVAIADLDGDGRIDLATPALTGGAISVIRNTSVPGALSFGATADYNSGGQTVSIAAGDIDGDSKQELLVYNYNGQANGNFACLPNTSTKGNISFAAPLTFPVSGYSLQGRNIYLADYNGDNKLDVLVLTDNSFSIFRNISTTGNINFAPAITQSFQDIKEAGTVANLSGDAKPDFLVGNWSQRFYSLIRNTSVPATIQNDVPLQVTPDYPDNIDFYNTACADFNGDGKTDIVASSPGDHKIVILKNTVGVPVPVQVCAGTNTSMRADLPGATYQWQQDTGTGFTNLSDNATFSDTHSAELFITRIPLAWNGYKYRCLVDGKESSVFQLRVQGSAKAFVSISTQDTVVCSGSTVTFKAIVINGGDDPFYQWQVNNTNIATRGSTFTTATLSNNDHVRLLLNSSAFCASPIPDTSNVLVMTVKGNPPAVSISAIDTAICSGTVATFTVTQTSNLKAPSYQWQVNDINTGTNSPTFSTTYLANSSRIKVIATGVTSCSTSATTTSNTIAMTVYPQATPYVSVTASTIRTCAGANVAFTAWPTNGGATPSYQWKKNGKNVGTNSNTYNNNSLLNGDSIAVVLTSSAPCLTTAQATSNPLIITVDSALTPQIHIAAATTTTTVGTSVMVTAIAKNSGGSPVYQWQDSTDAMGWQPINGAINNILKYTPEQTGDKVRCRLISGNTCKAQDTVLSNVLAFTVSMVTALDPDPATDLGIRWYPNPVTTTLNIDGLRLMDKWQTIDIASIEGKQSLIAAAINNHTRLSIPVKQLPAGFYVATLKRKEGTAVVLRFIKL